MFKQTGNSKTVTIKENCKFCVFKAKCVMWQVDWQTEQGSLWPA